MSKTLFVGCKIPSGMLLQLRDPQHPNVVLEERALEGSSSPMQPYVKPQGLGITEVEESFWSAWSAWAKKEQYAPFVNGQIFAGATHAEVYAQAKDKIKLYTGLEALDVTGTDARLGEFRAAGLAGGR